MKCICRPSVAPFLRLLVSPSFSLLRLLFFLSFSCRNISQTGNYVCTQKNFSPTGYVNDCKGEKRERETGRKAQASFFSLLLLLLPRGEERRECVETELHGRYLPLVSPFFPLFFCVCFPVSIMAPTCVLFFSPSLLSPARKESDAPASQLV